MALRRYICYCRKFTFLHEVVWLWRRYICISVKFAFLQCSFFFFFIRTRNVTKRYLVEQMKTWSEARCYQTI